MKTNKEIIEELKKIKIDHTDFDNDGFNRLCSTEISKIMNLFTQALEQKEREVRVDLKELFKARKVLTDTIASDVNSDNFNIYDVRRQIKDLDKLIIKLSNLKSNKSEGK